jgi:hypothetical protein
VVESILKNKWSIVSILVTLVNVTLIFSVIRYLYANHRWSPYPQDHQFVNIWEVTSASAALVLGVVGTFRGRSIVYGIAAVCLALFSFIIYVG